MPHKPFPKLAINAKENQCLALTVSLITEAISVVVCFL